MINVLFVDDEPAITRSLSKLFLRDANVFTAHAGIEALEILHTQRIHVLVSDQRMPKMTGAEVLREAREISPHTTRILLTGYSDLEAVMASVNEGEVYRYISKPWDSSELKKAVAEAGETSVRLFEADGSVTEKQPSQAAVARSGVLILDDNTAVIDAVKSVLGDGVALYFASNLAEAAKILETQPVSIVISELKLTTGYTMDFIKTLKKRYSHILVLVQTSVLDSQIAVELINNGSLYRYLPKPIRTGLLKISLHSAIEKSKSQKQK